MELITETEFKTFAGITSTKSDPRIAALITASSDAIIEYLGSVPIAGNVSEDIYTVEGRNSYLLSNMAASVKSIKYSYRGGPELELDSSTDYYVLEQEGKIVLYDTENVSGSRILTNGKLAVEYAIKDGELSDDIKLATCLLVNYYYKDQYNQQSMSAGGETVNYIGGRNFPPHVTSLLNLHRML